jgi:hypothetical protein
MAVRFFCDSCNAEVDKADLFTKKVEYINVVEGEIFVSEDSNDYCRKCVSETAKPAPKPEPAPRKPRGPNKKKNAETVAA